MDKSSKNLEKKILEARNDIFLKVALPTLQQQKFTQSPFSTAWFGKNNLGDYTYELIRLLSDNTLEMIVTHISKGDRWIKIFLNIFELTPELRSLDQLEGVDGLQYHLPPNSISKMRLKSDDIKGVPLFSYDFMFGGHKLKSFSNEKTLERRREELSNLLEKDLSNIDSFIKRWHELYKPNVTDWEGNRIQN